MANLNDTWRDHHIAAQYFVVTSINHESKLAHWTNNNHRSSPSNSYSITSNIPIHTYYTSYTLTSHIDHIFISSSYSSASVLTISTSEGPFWELHTNHRPLWIHHSVPGDRGTAGITKVYKPNKTESFPRRELFYLTFSIICHNIICNLANSCYEVWILFPQSLGAFS